MDSLTDIWTFWNQQIGATLATLLAAFALLKATGNEIRQVVSDVRKWRGWGTLARLCRTVVTRFRVRRAKNVMRQSLEGRELQIPIQLYDSSLRDDPSKSTRAQLEEITPTKPPWLNDYYVATALEALVTDGSVVKVERYGADSWPPKSIRYDFVAVTADESACEAAERRRTTDYCAAYQSVASCPRESRFEIKQRAKTVSTNRVDFNTAFLLKDTAPPCELCWEKDQQERDIRNLVENITKYDLAYEATEEITGTNGELQQAVVTACILSKCPAEPDLIRQVVKQAIDFRQETIAQDRSRTNHEWLQDEHQEFVAALKEYISSQMN